MISPSFYAITGVIGSGKSLISKLLEENGYFVINADHLSRQVVSQGTLGLQKITDAFGGEILTETGELDRKKLGARIFSNTDEKLKLEQIVHPLIRAAFDEYLNNYTGARPVLYDIPLFFETNYQHPNLKGVIVVSAPEALCIERVIKRDGLSKEEVQKRIQSQIPISQKESQADYVVQNTGTIEDAKQEVSKLITWLESQTK